MGKEPDDGWTWRVVDPDGNTVEFSTEPIVITGLALSGGGDN
jgi:hypothetical protein